MTQRRPAVCNVYLCQTAFYMGQFSRESTDKMQSFKKSTGPFYVGQSSKHLKQLEVEVPLVFHTGSSEQPTLPD
jgi:hypothetical protein